MRLPDYTPDIIPEGHYDFKVVDEPEQRRKTYNDRKTGAERETLYLLVPFSARDSETGRTLKHREAFFTHEKRYKDLLLATGGVMKPDGNIEPPDSVDMVGKRFKARIAHEADKRDPSKTRARIQDIVSQSAPDEDVPPPGEDDIPF